MISESDYYEDIITGLEKTIVSLEKRTYAAPHVWNLVAKEIRGAWPISRSNDQVYQIIRNTLTDLALDFAHRFNEKDEGFDPLSFLDKCSPNTDLYPLSEMWDEDSNNE